MDRSRFGAVDAEVTFVSSPAEVIAALEATVAGNVTVGAQVDLVVLDLGRPGAIDAARTLRSLDSAGPGLRVIGFVSHVDSETKIAAQEAGIDDVLPRSRFFSRIVGIVTQGHT